MPHTIRIVLSLTLMMSIASPVFAQSRAELAAQNEALRLRIDRLESRMLTGDPAAERLMGRVDTLDTTIRTLRGEIERLSYERELADAEMAALESDIRILQTLSTRMQIHLDAVDLVAAQNAPQVDDTYMEGPATISQIQGPPTSRQQTFVLPPASDNGANDTTMLLEMGKSLLAEGDYSGAETALSQYLQFNPDATDRGEANFWFGESLFVQGQYNAAAESYIASMRASGNGPKPGRAG